MNTQLSSRAYINIVIYSFSTQIRAFPVVDVLILAFFFHVLGLGDPLMSGHIDPPHVCKVCTILWHGYTVHLILPH